MENFRSKTTHAAGWVIGSQVASQSVSFGIGIALARLLTPDDFGLIAMVLAFTGVAHLLVDVGLGAALIQKKDVSEKHFTSVFWINFFLGCLLALLLFFLSPLIAGYYNRPDVEGVAKVLSIIFVIGSLALVPRNRLVKELLYKYIALSDFISMMVSGGVAVVLAVNGFGYWSLVFQQLLQQIISTLMIWKYGRWRPKGWICKDAVKELWGFSSYVFSTRLLFYFSGKLDVFLLGRYMGGQVLGLYDKGQSIMLFPLQNVSHMVGSIMFPALSKIQTDMERVRYVYLRSTRAVAFVTFPMMVGVFVVSKSFVLGVLGPQWEELIPLIKIFSVAGVAMSIVTLVGSIYLSQGAAKLQFRVSLIYKPITIAAIVGGLSWGVIGVATGFAISKIINGVIALIVAGRLINLRLFAMVRILIPIILVSVTMGVLVWSIRQLLDIKNEIFIFLIQLVSGVFIYWGLVAGLRLKAYQDIAKVVSEEFRLWKNK